MCGGFGSLAEQGFPHTVRRSAGRRLVGERGLSGGKDRAASFFDAVKPLRMAHCLVQGFFNQMEIHQQTPYLSITVAQQRLHGSSWMPSSTTPPSFRMSKARRTASSLPISKALKVMVSHFI